MRSLISTVTIAATLLFNLTAFHAHAGDGEATLFKNPQCGCCSAYADHLRQSGYKVKEVPTDQMSLIKRSYGISDDMASCHTTLIDGYVIEGHVPINVVDKFLDEKPNVTGIFLPGMPMGSPGMPMGSPGMGVDKEAPFKIYSYSLKENNSSIEPYAVE